MAYKNAPVHTRWKKGQSGNPNGQPKKLPSLDILMAHALGQEDKDGVTAADAILFALIKKAERGDVKAAEMLFNRGYGKPKETIDQAIKIEPVEFNLKNLTPEELSNLLALRKKATE